MMHEDRHAYFRFIDPEPQALNGGVAIVKTSIDLANGAEDATFLLISRVTG